MSGADVCRTPVFALFHRPRVSGECTARIRPRDAESSASISSLTGVGSPPSLTTTHSHPVCDCEVTLWRARARKSGLSLVLMMTATSAMLTQMHPSDRSTSSGSVFASRTIGALGRRKSSSPILSLTASVDGSAVAYQRRSMPPGIDSRPTAGALVRVRVHSQVERNTPSRRHPETAPRTPHKTHTPEWASED